MRFHCRDRQTTTKNSTVSSKNEAKHYNIPYHFSEPIYEQHSWDIGASPPPPPRQCHLAEKGLCHWFFFLIVTKICDERGHKGRRVYFGFVWGTQSLTVGRPGIRQRRHGGRRERPTGYNAFTVKKGEQEVGLNHKTYFQWPTPSRKAGFPKGSSTFRSSAKSWQKTECSNRWACVSQFTFKAQKDYIPLDSALLHNTAHCH